MKSDFAEKLRTLFFPRKCLNCSCAIAEGILCDDCLIKIKPKTFSLELEDGKTFECLALQAYSEGFRESVQAFKFSGAYKMSEDFATLAKLNLDDLEITADVITFVPMTKSRQRARGYNQAESLAVAIAEKLDVPCEKLLRKTRNNLVQHTLTAEERRKNVIGVYDFSSKNLIKDRTIILVDDIITTGATMSECAKVLYESGAKKVFGVCVAYSV